MNNFKFFENHTNRVAILDSIEGWKTRLQEYNHHITDEKSLGYDLIELKTNKENMIWCTIIIFNNEIIYVERKFLFDDEDIILKFPTEEQLMRYIFT